MFDTIYGKNFGNLKKKVEIVEKLLYNRDKLNEKCKKQWKNACIKYISCAIMIVTFYTLMLIVFKDNRVFCCLIKEIWVTRRK